MSVPQNQTERPRGDTPEHEPVIPREDWLAYIAWLADTGRDDRLPMRALWLGRGIPHHRRVKASYRRIAHALVLEVRRAASDGLDDDCATHLGQCVGCGRRAVHRGEVSQCAHPGCGPADACDGADR